MMGCFLSKAFQFIEAPPAFFLHKNPGKTPFFKKPLMSKESKN